MPGATGAGSNHSSQGKVLWEGMLPLDPWPQGIDGWT